MELRTTIESIRFHNRDSGWFVAKSPEGTVVGTAEFLTIGTDMIFTGKWINDRRWGKQFKATDVRYPDSVSAIKALLGSGFLKNVKAHKAAAIVGTFGDGVFDVLDRSIENPSILEQVKGLGKITAPEVAESWKEQRGWARSAMICMQAGLSITLAKRVHKRFNGRPGEIIKNEPYRLTLVKGIGWDRADGIAKMEWPGKVAIDHDDPMRYAAALREVLERAHGMGHMCLPTDGAIQSAIDLAQPTEPEVFAPVIKTVLDDEGLVSVDEHQMLYLATLHKLEQTVANKLSGLLKAKGEIESPKWNSIKIEKYTSLDLSPDQQDAIRLALENKVAIITGGPGTGKTTCLATLVNILDHHGLSYSLCAPTGKAAIRMKEAIGQPAGTIHKTLEMRPGASPRNRFNTSYVIIDESSMIDESLMGHIVDSIDRGSHLVLIGDADQLPSVGAGEVFYRCIQAKLPTVRLRVIHRQGKNSGIIHAAHCINNGKAPPRNDYDDFKYGIVGNNEALPQTTISYLERVMKKYNFRFNDIQILTPVNGHSWGRRALNRVLQTKYNPGPFPLPYCPFKLEDRVIQLRNDYEKCVMNGEIGHVVWVKDPEEAMRKPETSQSDGMFELNDNRIPVDKSIIEVEYGSGLIRYERADLDDLDLAYALTIHKSQGSEYPAVILLVPTAYEPFMLRQLPYTGITRAKEYCLVIGVGNALDRYAGNEKRVRRHTLLDTMIKTALQVP